MQKEEQQQNISASTAVKNSSRSSSSTLLQAQPPTGILPNTETSAINNRLNNVLTTIHGLLENGEINEGIVRLLELGEKINIFQFLKNNGKTFDHKFQIVCYYNLACAYQMLVFMKNNMQDLNDCITNVNQAIKATTQIIRNQQKLAKQDNLINFKMKIFHVKMQLQCCALLSQVQNHEMALQYGREALAMLTHIFKKAKSVAKNQLKKIKEKKIKNPATRDQATIFTENLLNLTLKELEELQLIDNFEGVMSISTSNFEKIKQNSYFWKNNFENNSKTFKKQMNKITEATSKSNTNSPLKKGSLNYYSCEPLQSKQNPTTGSTSIRNCLGMRISNSWISSLNIGRVMKMAPIGYVYFIEPGNISFQFSSRNLIQKVILVCAIYFSLATQMRFLEDSQADPKKKSSSNSPPTKKSQLFHFKAIELAYKYIKQDCPLVDHLITSYLKHYHSSLTSIQQKPSFVEHSQIFGQVKKSTLINCHQMENQLIEGTGDYMILDCHGGDEIDGVFSSRHTLAYQKSTRIKLIDSIEVERGGLAKSVQWSKKVSPSKDFSNNKSNLSKSKQLSNSTRLKLLKKSSSTSTMAKDSITIKEPKTPQPQCQKSKLKRNSKSSKKNIMKIIKIQR